MGALVEHIQEVVFQDALVFLALREDVARWRYVEIHGEEMTALELDVSRYLAAKERGVSDRSDDRERWGLEVDLSPFERGFPKIEDPDSIGRGVEFLNRHLSTRLFEKADGRRRLMDFLRVHEVQGRPLLLNGTLETVEELRDALHAGVELLRGRPRDEVAWNRELRGLGFEPGWGRTVARAQESMELLAQLLDDVLERVRTKVNAISTFPVDAEKPVIFSAAGLK